MPLLGFKNNKQEKRTEYQEIIQYAASIIA